MSNNKIITLKCDYLGDQGLLGVETKISFEVTENLKKGLKIAEEMFKGNPELNKFLFKEDMIFSFQDEDMKEVRKEGVGSFNLKHFQNKIVISSFFIFGKSYFVPEEITLEEFKELILF